MFFGLPRLADQAGREPAVVGDDVIRDDQVFLAVDGGPVGQVVVVGVAVVGEAALFDQQFPGVNAGAVAAVPSDRPCTGGLLDRGDRLGDVLPLLVPGQQGDVLPPVAVGDDVVHARADIPGDIPIALQGHGAGVERAL